MGQISNYHDIRPKPKVWAGSAHSLVKKRHFILAYNSWPKFDQIYSTHSYKLRYKNI